MLYTHQDLESFTMKSNTVVVLLTDTIYPSFHDDHGHFGDQGVALLQRADTDEFIKDYIIVDCINQKLPTIDWLMLNYDNGAGFLKGVYITGSKFDSFATDIDWIVRLREFLSEIVLTLKFERIPPFVGICFGHQIISCAAGLKVGRNSKGCEIGMKDIELTEKGRMIFASKESLSISEIHNDIVYDKPLDDWYNIAGNDICANQAFYKAGKLLTFQGHPEFHKAVAEKVYQASFADGEINETVYQDALASCSSQPNDGALMAGAMIRLFKNEI